MKHGPNLAPDNTFANSGQLAQPFASWAAKNSEGMLNRPTNQKREDLVKMTQNDVYLSSSVCECVLCEASNQVRANDSGA